MRRILNELIGLAAVLAGVGVPALRGLRGEVPVPGVMAGVVFALLVGAGRRA
ncbi:hypothetical protein [Thermus sp.]|jgi:hypothetical protein|uniref:hypothetical protein n=1 Tax=Thermus sp. TaxID=275 RepID=UPI003D0D2203